jgi:hypothetical protein
LIEIKALRPLRWLDDAMRNFIFRCPVSGLSVQGSDTGTESAPHYVAESCLACGGVHVVNPATGKLLSEEHVPAQRLPRDPRRMA